MTNSFNEIYPNVSFGYEQVGAEHLNEFMQNNPYVDIFMTNDDNIRSSAQPERYVSEFCVDLAAEDIDLSAVTPEMQSGFYR